MLIYALTFYCLALSHHRHRRRRHYSLMCDIGDQSIGLNLHSDRSVCVRERRATAVLINCKSHWICSRLRLRRRTLEVHKIDWLFERMLCMLGLESTSCPKRTYLPTYTKVPPIDRKCALDSSDARIRP